MRSDVFIGKDGGALCSNIKGRVVQNWREKEGRGVGNGEGGKESPLVQSMC